MTTLVLPHADGYDAWVDAVAADNGEGLNGSGPQRVPGLETSREAFQAMVTSRLNEQHDGPHLKPGYVPCSYYWIMEGQVIAGHLAIRHRLNDHLVKVGGHIGYRVRADMRRRGIATRALACAIPKAADLGIDSILITCDEENIGSRKVIEGNGGRYQDSYEGKRRYWITPPHP